ncbi:MAG TPA: hypothetical protein VG826_14100 [Pirellulales bacterium]|nr:hypothetical protein [Pirellulales bacterium]
MRWPAAIFVAAACAVGCRSASSSDPFLRTTVPPPPTGSASGTQDPYYSPAPPYGGGAPAYQAPAYQVPAGGAPSAGGANGPFAPSGYGSPTPGPAGGGFGAVPGPVPTSQVSPATSQAPRMAKASYVSTADDEPSAVYQRRLVATRGVAADAEASSPRTSPAGRSFGGASLAGSSSQSIDIMDLPPVLASR